MDQLDGGQKRFSVAGHLGQRPQGDLHHGFQPVGLLDYDVYQFNGTKWGSIGYYALPERIWGTSKQGEAFLGKGRSQSVTQQALQLARVERRDGGSVRTGKLVACEPGDEGYGKTTPKTDKPPRKRVTKKREIITLDMREPGKLDPAGRRRGGAMPQRWRHLRNQAKLRAW